MTLQERLRQVAEEWLEQQLLPLAVAAAGLPAGTSAEELLQMQIPKANAGKGATDCFEDIAQIRCSENFLFGALELAAKMAGSERAEQIKDRIQGLMWRDGVELGRAVTLFQDLSASGYLTDDAWIQQDRAEARWNPWDETDAAAKKSLEAFLFDYNDIRFTYERVG